MKIETWRQRISTSVSEYGQRVWSRWWSMIPAGIGAVLGLIAVAVPSSPTHAFIPSLLWFGLLFGGLVLAQFLAFHDVRIDRDETRKEEERRFNAYKYRFQMAALEGSPTVFMDEGGAGKPGYKMTLIFKNGSTEVMEYEIKDLAVILGGRTAIADFDNSVGIILPGDKAKFNYSQIYAPTDPPLAGTGTYRVVYGHPESAERYVTEHKFMIGWNVFKSLDGKTQSYAAEWHTMGKVTHSPYLGQVSKD
jgi:hypothetical protein